MDLSTTTLSCTRCGKAANGHSTRDGKGNVYCRACIERLSGSDAPARSAMHPCALCGVVFQNDGHGAARPEGKGQYCPDCLSRLHGRRHARRSATAPTIRDVAFDQMFAEIFSERQPTAMAS